MILAPIVHLPRKNSFGQPFWLMTLTAQFRGSIRSSAQQPNGNHFQAFGALKVLLRKGEPFTILALAMKMPVEGAFEALVIAGEHEENVQLTAILKAQLIDALVWFRSPANFDEVIVGTGKVDPSPASVPIVPVPRFALGALHGDSGCLPAIAAFVAIAKEHRNALYHGYSITKICYVVTTFLLTDNVPMVQN